MHHIWVSDNSTALRIFVSHLTRRHSDNSCKAPIVSLDQSHQELEADTATRGFSVGSQLVAVKCEETDIQTPTEVLNGNYVNHRSLSFKSACPGDRCNSNTDCLGDRTTNFLCDRGEPRTCKRAAYLGDGARCESDAECRTGICARRDYFGKATNRSFCSSRRVNGDLCEVDSECPQTAPQCCVSRFLKDRSNAKPRCDNRSSCNEQTSRACKPNGEGCLANSSCCSGKCRPGEIFFIPVCTA